MRNMKKIGLALSTMLVMSMIAGCVQVNPEKDRKLVVAEVNGEQILKGEVLDILEQQKEYFQLTDAAIKDPKQKEYVLTVKKQILDGIVTERLLIQKAEQAGFVATDELREEARKEFDDIKKQIEEQMKASGEQEDKDYAKEAEEFIQNQLEAMGKTEEEYIEILVQEKCIDKFQEETVEDVRATQDEVQKYYNEELAKQKDNLNYADSSQVKLYEPDRIRIKHIMIELPQEKSTEYAQLISQEGKEKEAEELLEKELSNIKPEAQKILDRAKGGQDFNELLQEVDAEQAEMMEEGLVIHKDNMYLPEEYMDAAFKLKEQEISGLVATSYGYFIIKLEEKLPQTTYTLQDKETDIQEVVGNIKKMETWESILDDWKKQGIKTYERRL